MKSNDLLDRIEKRKGTHYLIDNCVRDLSELSANLIRWKYGSDNSTETTHAIGDVSLDLLEIMKNIEAETKEELEELENVSHAEHLMEDYDK